MLKPAGIFILQLLIQSGSCWFWASPASKEQTIDDCHRMKEEESIWYPNYCDDLLAQANSSTESSTHRHHLSKHSAAPPPAEPVLPDKIIGWGWSQWNEWVSDACPDFCGRRCRKRVRYCNGPYNLICKGRGKPDDFDDCPELTEDDTNSGGGGFQRRTTLPADDYYDSGSFDSSPDRFPDYGSSSIMLTPNRDHGGHGHRDSHRDHGLSDHGNDEGNHHGEDDGEGNREGYRDRIKKKKRKKRVLDDKQEFS